jgi:N-acetylglucosaminyldiphosphoundecaprenol N-acetyl-beta-D-mannosaminyltransferase
MLLRTEDIVGYEVCNDSEARVVDCVTDWIDANQRDCRYFACLNPHSVEIAADDKIFHKSLACADFLTADGVGIIYASRILGGQIRRRITGSDVFLGVTAAMNQVGGSSCFFLGATEETLAKIRDQMAVTFPNVTVAGSYSPPFKPEFSRTDNRDMIDAINRCSPDVLWVGMTAPKQEKWIFEHRRDLDVNFAGPIGGVFDFFVGNIERAGPLMQNLGLEWLPRFLQEPRRLWRRALVSAPRFLLRTVRYRLQKPG